MRNTGVLYLTADLYYDRTLTASRWEAARNVRLRVLYFCLHVLYLNIYINIGSVFFTTII